MTTVIISLDIQFSVIGLTETWLKQNDPLYNLQSYIFIGNSRKERTGGGVGIFFKEEINMKHRDDLDICTVYIY